MSDSRTRTTIWEKEDSPRYLSFSYDSDGVIHMYAELQLGRSVSAVHMTLADADALELVTKLGLGLGAAVVSRETTIENETKELEA